MVGAPARRPGVTSITSAVARAAANDGITARYVIDCLRLLNRRQKFEMTEMGVILKQAIAAAGSAKPAAPIRLFLALAGSRGGSPTEIWRAGLSSGRATAERIEAIAARLPERRPCRQRARGVLASIHSTGGRVSSTSKARIPDNSPCTSVKQVAAAPASAKSTTRGGTVFERHAPARPDVRRSERRALSRRAATACRKHGGTISRAHEENQLSPDTNSQPRSFARRFGCTCGSR